MVDRCNICGAKFVKFPIKQQQNKTLEENFKEKTINYKNLFAMDMMSLLFFILVLFLVFMYNHDVGTCKEFIEDPYTYCEGLGYLPIEGSDSTESYFELFNISLED